MEGGSAFQEFFDEASGLPYWLNLETQETTWEDPGSGYNDGGEYAAAGGSDEYNYDTGGGVGYDTGGGVEGAAFWEQYVDDGTGLPYWFNPQTQETTWEDPHV